MSANTFPQSDGKQFTQSLGLQRGRGFGDPVQTWQEVIILHFTERSFHTDPTVPPPAPIPQASLTTELLAVDWGIFNNVSQIQEFGIIYDPTTSPVRSQHLYTFDALGFEWQLYPLITSYPINNMFPGLPIVIRPGNSPVPYIGQRSLQCSFWKTQTGIDAPREVWRSWTYVQRCRYKWNRPVTHGFFAVANIWYVNHLGERTGIGGQSDGGDKAISLEDVTLVSEHTNVRANTWIEPPYHFDQGQPGGFTDGFAGQIMLSIDFETPAEWSARTGIRIS